MRFWIPILSVSVCWSATASADSKASHEATLDELLNIEESARPAVVPSPSDPAAALRERLDDTRPSGELQMALREMEKASQRMDRRLDPGVQTQRLQASVIARLEAEIERAKKQCSKCRSGGSGQAKPGDTGSSENTSSGPAKPSGAENNVGSFSPGRVRPQEGAPAPIEETRSEWGNLPPRLRDELVQGVRERFSHLYRKLTEDYYRHLAERSRP